MKVQPGDIIKVKYRGMKTKFQVLGSNDIITDDCVQQMVHDVHSEEMRKLTVDEYDEKVLSKFNPNNTCYPVYRDSNNIGDKVSDGHLHRIYLRQLNNLY